MPNQPSPSASSIGYYPPLSVAGKICLVTGGTSGIGRAIALGLAQAGAVVVAGSTNPEKVAAIKQELGAGHEAVKVDISDEASAKAAVDFTVKKFGRIDAMVNAAGVIKKQPSMEMPVAEFDRIVRVNLTGTFIMDQAVGRVMKDQTADARGVRGAILNVASLNSFISFSEVLAYASSKSGVLGLTRGLANEWAQFGIRVNAIAPGVFPTDLNRPLIEGTPRGQWLRQHTPMNRFGESEELVGAAIYLLSPAASFTTGETIIVDGGFLSKAV